MDVQEMLGGGLLSAYHVSKVIVKSGARFDDYLRSIQGVVTKPPPQINNFALFYTPCWGLHIIWDMPCVSACIPYHASAIVNDT